MKLKPFHRTNIRRHSTSMACFVAALCLMAASTHAALVSNLQLHATLDPANISGTQVQDTAPPAHDGTINGTVPQVAGRIGGALDFTNSDANNVSFGNVLNPGSNSYTASFWFNSDDFATAGPNVLIGKGNEGSTSAGWVVFHQSTSLVVRGSVGGANVGERFSQEISLTSSQTGNGQWHHLALVIDRDTNTIQGYLDGSNGGFVNGGGGPTSNTIINNNAITTASNLLLGRRGTAGAPFDGRLDDVAIYDRALTPTEIATIAAAGFDAAPRNVFNAQAGPLGGTFYGLTPTDDAFVDSANPNTNRNDQGTANGHGGGLVISGDDSPVLQFDLTSVEAPAGYLLAGVVPGSARLVLQETDGGINATDIQGHRLLSAWGESTITFNNLPAFDPTAAFTSATHVAGTNLFDGPGLDALVEDWLLNPASNFGLVLFASGGEDAYRSRHQSLAPRLEFELAFEQVPEPSSFALWSLLGLAMAWRVRRARRAA